MTALLPAPASVIVWRKLRPRLWAGRADGAHLGTIERGRRFTATDLDGDRHRGYRTLRAAQAALTGEIPILVEHARDASTAPRLLLLGTTAAMLASVALSTMGIALLD
jgi:hypothetical protein